MRFGLFSAALSAGIVAIFVAPAAPQGPTPPSPLPGPTFVAWSTTVPDVTGPLPTLYVDYNPLHYTNAKLTDTVKVIDPVDLSAILPKIAALTGNPSASDVRELAKALNEQQSQKNCGTASTIDTFRCRVRDEAAEAAALASIYERDVKRLDAVLNPKNGTIFAHVTKDDDDLAKNKDHSGTISSIVTDSKNFSNVLSQQLSPNADDWRSELAPDPKPTPLLPSARTKQQAGPICKALPAGDANPLIEITDGCANLLASDASALSLELQKAMASKTGPALVDFKSLATSLDATLKKVGEFATASGDGSKHDAYKKQLEAVETWAKRFKGVKAADFTLTWRELCKTGSGGSVATVHFSANDRFAPAPDPQKPEVVKDVVIVHCYAPLAIGASAGWSRVPQTTYSVAQTAFQTNGPSTGSPPSPVPTFQSFYRVSQSQTSGRTVGGVFVYRCLCANPGDGMNPYASFALAGSGKDVPDLLLGLSMGFSRKYFLTLGGHWATDTTLGGTSHVGDLVPSGFSLQTGKQRVFRPAITFGIATPSK